VAVGLRLGTAICEAHTCPCGATVDSLGRHALSCKKHPGRVQRHARINDLIHHSLILAEIPATKEPQGLSRNDGKRPDGLTLVPCMEVRMQRYTGRDCCPYTGCFLCVAKCVTGRKCRGGRNREEVCQVYSSLSSSHYFIPVAVVCRK